MTKEDMENNNFKNADYIEADISGDFSQEFFSVVNTVDFADELLNIAIFQGASDIHIQPFKDRTEIRLRINGKIKSNQHITNEQYLEVVGRYKVLSQLRIDIKDIPQDGSFSHLNYRVRISTMPSIDGECVVLRLLDSLSLQIQYLPDTGMSQCIFKRLLNTIRSMPGLIVFSGATGSGKSTSAYSLLASLIEDNKQILTIEDPIERRVAGLRQIQIRPISGFTYAHALKASMRQDPDIIYVGEVRDSETMKSVMSLSLTGHTVITTIHARDVRMAIRRCVYLGADAYELSMVLRAFFNQRLEIVPNDFTWSSKQIAVFESLINDKDGDVYNCFLNSENINDINLSDYKENFTYESMSEDFENKFKS